MTPRSPRTAIPRTHPPGRPRELTEASQWPPLNRFDKTLMDFHLELLGILATNPRHVHTTFSVEEVFTGLPMKCQRHFENGIAPLDSACTPPGGRLWRTCSTADPLGSEAAAEGEAALRPEPFAIAIRLEVESAVVKDSFGQIDWNARTGPVVPDTRHHGAVSMSDHQPHRIVGPPQPQATHGTERGPSRCALSPVEAKRGEKVPPRVCSLWINH
jgi:hypothetical protein